MCLAKGVILQTYFSAQMFVLEKKRLRIGLNKQETTYENV